MTTNGSGETPQQAVERELRAAQEEVRRVAERLRAGLTEEDRLAWQSRDGRLVEQSSSDVAKDAAGERPGPPEEGEH